MCCLIAEHLQLCLVLQGAAALQPAAGSLVSCSSAGPQVPIFQATFSREGVSFLLTHTVQSIGDLKTLSVSLNDPATSQEAKVPRILVSSNSRQTMGRALKVLVLHQLTNALRLHLDRVFLKVKIVAFYI